MAAPLIDFESAWASHWMLLGLFAPDSPVLSTLLARWAEPHRRYHAPQHLGECLVQFNRMRDLARHPGEVALALWFHDAVYDTHRHDNEAESADWASRVLAAAGAAPDVCARVHALIMATCHSGQAETADARLVVDIDLSVLGAERDRFDEYERQIREEYGFVPEPLFREKRAEILRDFLDRPSIYQTEACAAAFEQQARANLTRAVAALEPSPGA